MLKKFIAALIAVAFFAHASASAATFYDKTTGSATNSGTTDTDAARVGGSAIVITCSATTYTGATAGCLIAGNPDLSAVVTTVGPTQDALFVNCATNANHKIFKITAVTNGSGLIQTSETITGCTAASTTWSIGGRHVPSASDATIEGAVFAGDLLLYEDAPATSASTQFTFRNAGDSSNGPTIVRCSSTAVVLESTSTNPTIQGNSLFNTVLQNCGIKEDGASGFAVNASGANFQLLGDKITKAGGDCVNAAQTPFIIGGEITGCGGNGVTAAGTQTTIRDVNIHDVTGDCIKDTSTTPSAEISFDILAKCGGMGINQSGAVAANASQAMRIASDTIYGNTGVGIGFADKDTPCFMENLLVQDNGTAGNGNVYSADGGMGCTGTHQYNIVYQSGAGGNITGFLAPNGFTAATWWATFPGEQVAVNPLMVAPASANYALQVGSPARAAGFPGQFVGGNLGSLSIGAVQPAASSTGYIIGG